MRSPSADAPHARARSGGCSFRIAAVAAPSSFSYGTAWISSIRAADRPSSASVPAATFAAHLGAAHAQVRRALHGRAVEQPLRRGHRHQRADLRAAARLPEDHHVARVATEPRDVVAHPLEREHDVEHAGVAGARVFLAVGRQVQVPEDVQAVVERDDDDVAAPREPLAVVGLQLLARPVGEPAAVQPHHHRPLAPVEPRRPDVDAQAVLARLPVVPLEHERLFVEGPARRAGRVAPRGRNTRRCARPPTAPASSAAGTARHRPLSHRTEYP